jgi:predicted ATPase
LATGTFCRGQALAAQGEEEEGIAQMLEGSSGYRAVGAQSYRTGFLAALAEAYLKRGWPDQAMGTLTEALTIAENTGERYQEARLYQLKGELLLRADGRASEPEAEQNFRTGIRIAKRQYARSWELRATMSLARLLAQQNKRDEARTMLAKIYGWFTEELDTAELKDAKALLDELGA